MGTTRAAWLVPMLVLGAATFGQAATYRVGLEDSLNALQATRHDVGARFDVAATALERAAASQPATAIGTAEQPAELSEGATPASTAVVAGRWTYAVTIREREANGVASGQFVVELLVNGDLVGQLHVQQALANPAVAEAARATFDLGDRTPDGALFLVRVSAAGAGIIAHTLTSAVRAGAPPFYVWTGEGGDNPTLAARVGVELRITIVNGDGTTVPHNLVIVQGDTEHARTPPDEDIDQRDERTQLRWTPDAAGAYEYTCEYHSSMTGTLQVTA